MLACLIRIGFMVWHVRHGGLRRFRHAKFSKFRALKWRAVIILREVYI